MSAWLEQLSLVFVRGVRPPAPTHAGCTCALEAAALNTLTTGIELPGRKES